MKVICAGMSKCGTKSMHVALEQLGYSVHDFDDGFLHYDKQYTKFFEEGWTTGEFREMYENIDAVVDGPAYYFWEELAEAFPDAKVVLMVRDNEEIWYQSIKKQFAAFDGPYLAVYSIFGSSTWTRLWKFMGNPALLPFGAQRTTDFSTRALRPAEIPFKGNYRRHIAHVKHACPKDRLLVLNVKEGWEPLCEFLCKPIPDQPFPRINVGGELSSTMWEADFLKLERKKMWRNLSLTIFSGVLCLFVMKFNAFRPSHFLDKIRG